MRLVLKNALNKAFRLADSENYTLNLLAYVPLLNRITAATFFPGASGPDESTPFGSNFSLQGTAHGKGSHH